MRPQTAYKIALEILLGNKKTKELETKSQNMNHTEVVLWTLNEQKNQNQPSINNQYTPEPQNIKREQPTE